MLQIIDGVEDSVAIAALPGGRAHAIEEQRVFGSSAGIVLVIAGVNAEPVCGAGVKLIEEWDEPRLLFVKNSDWFGECGWLSRDGHKSSGGGLPSIGCCSA